MLQAVALYVEQDHKSFQQNWPCPISFIHVQHVFIPTGRAPVRQAPFFPSSTVPLHLVTHHPPFYRLLHTLPVGYKIC